MPKILSINNYHYRRGGSDVMYLDHAALMEEQGWRNGFFSMNHPQNLDTPWSKYFIDEIEFGHDYSLAKKLIMASKVVYSFEAQKKLKRLLQDYRPDVAHLHCIYHHLSPAIISTLHDARVPIVMTAHELKAICPAATMRNSGGICERCKDGSVANILLNRCIKDSLALSALVAVETLVHKRLNTYKKYISRLILPSRFYLEKYLEWGWPREKLVHIPNFVDADNLIPECEPGSYFLYFGRLSVEKGLSTLIQAAKVAKVPLKIVGAGPEVSKLKLLANSSNGDIYFLGHRTGEDLYNIIRGAKAVVIPSEWYENAPLSILESYALGKPVIGARIGGIPELIVERKTGWSFSSGSILELAEVLTLVDQLSLYTLSEMGRQARFFVESKFSKDNYRNQILCVYASLGVPR